MHFAVCRLFMNLVVLILMFIFILVVGNGMDIYDELHGRGKTYLRLSVLSLSRMFFSSMSCRIVTYNL